ncbi:hypothetical protein BCR36DRAFT_446756 [Piromyces finnis]|uniref:Uncharacterized protein n=1 Tax=Piromyces finnis TaxID=1754191 RepID=A0A1Y1UAS7_9FUNG|nr:hypothetical protein BCR36DRAFT_446756 [Piromyces finnis]|eukprot:ORX34617.1 hypothetical protein BCR36DRAFT_446756 [Piromyces finnis]
MVYCFNSKIWYRKYYYSDKYKNVSKQYLHMMLKKQLVSEYCTFKIFDRITVQYQLKKLVLVVFLKVINEISQTIRSRNSVESQNANNE